jgi:hypothetical protein
MMNRKGEKVAQWIFKKIIFVRLPRLCGKK